jgi:hypothetical protein
MKKSTKTIQSFPRSGIISRAVFQVRLGQRRTQSENILIVNLMIVQMSSVILVSLRKTESFSIVHRIPLHTQIHSNLSPFYRIEHTRSFFGNDMGSGQSRKVGDIPAHFPTHSKSMLRTVNGFGLSELQYRRLAEITKPSLRLPCQEHEDLARLRLTHPILNVADLKNTFVRAEHAFWW